MNALSNTISSEFLNVVSVKWVTGFILDFEEVGGAKKVEIKNINYEHNIFLIFSFI